MNDREVRALALQLALKVQEQAPSVHMATLVLAESFSDFMFKPAPPDTAPHPIDQNQAQDAPGFWTK